MVTPRSDQVRISRSAREAVARHEPVVVMNRERAVCVLLSPDDHSPSGRPRGRPAREVLALLKRLPGADAEFAGDMDVVLGSAGSAPESPWERS